MTDTPNVRVRFCPSPTGTPHVGLVRTALFNWAYARHTGGAFVFRDRGHRLPRATARRATPPSWTRCAGWAGLGRGPGDRRAVRAVPAVRAWRDLPRRDRPAARRRTRCTRPIRRAEEVEARHVAAGRNPKLGYDNYDRDSDRRRSAPRSPPRGASPCCACGCPTRTSPGPTWCAGPTTFAAGIVPDFAITRGNGDPLYTLVNPVDDALMKITHVLRGEDILPSTPRQIALYRALMRDRCRRPRSRIRAPAKRSRSTGTRSCPSATRSPICSCTATVASSPRALLNYLALLGWGIADDHDVFSLDEMVAAFDVANVNSNPARFDQKKADAINAEHIRLLAVGDFAARLAATSWRTGTTPVSTTPGSPRRPPWCRPASWCSATRGIC